MRSREPLFRADVLVSDFSEVPVNLREASSSTNTVGKNPGRGPEYGGIGFDKVEDKIPAKKSRSQVMRETNR